MYGFVCFIFFFFFFQSIPNEKASTPVSKPATPTSSGNTTPGPSSGSGGGGAIKPGVKYPLAGEWESAPPERSLLIDTNTNCNFLFTFGLCCTLIKHEGNLRFLYWMQRREISSQQKFLDTRHTPTDPVILLFDDIGTTFVVSPRVFCPCNC
jgi:hypothetical protein